MDNLAKEIEELTNRIKIIKATDTMLYQQINEAITEFLLGYGLPDSMS